MKTNKNSLEFQLGLVSAPEDFPPQLRSLSNLDSTLRCPICKEFYQAPVLIHIPKCCHTFCSACIRTCFNNDSNNQKIRATGLGGVGNSHRCPICKVEAQEEKIKPVPTLESAVICWQQAREEILSIISRLQSFEAQPQLKPQKQDPHPVSIPQPSASSSTVTSNRPQTRSTRSVARQALPEEQAPSFFRNHRLDFKSSQARASSPPKKRKLSSQSAGQQDSDDSIQLLSYNPTDPSAPVQCPICQKQMLNSSMDSHVTKCLNETKNMDSTETSHRSSGQRIKKNSQKEQEGTKPNQTRIPLPHFSSLKPKAIQAELIRHELNLTGTTSDQIRRLSKYITLFNANLDAQLVHQKSIESIKDQVYLWEGLQDSENIKLDQRHKKILNNQQDYLKKHKSHFDLLIEQASKSLKKSTPTTPNSSTQAPIVIDNDDQEADIEKQVSRCNDNTNNNDVEERST